MDDNGNDNLSENENLHTFAPESLRLRSIAIGKHIPRTPGKNILIRTNIDKGCCIYWDYCYINSKNR